MSGIGAVMLSGAALFCAMSKTKRRDGYSDWDSSWWDRFFISCEPAASMLISKKDVPQRFMADHHLNIWEWHREDIQRCMAKYGWEIRWETSFSVMLQPKRALV